MFCIYLLRNEVHGKIQKFQNWPIILHATISVGLTCDTKSFGLGG